MNARRSLAILAALLVMAALGITVLCLDPFEQPADRPLDTFGRDALGHGALREVFDDRAQMATTRPGKGEQVAAAGDAVFGIEVHQQQHGLPDDEHPGGNWHRERHYDAATAHAADDRRRLPAHDASSGRLANSSSASGLASAS